MGRRGGEFLEGSGGIVGNRYGHSQIGMASDVDNDSRGIRSVHGF